MLKLLPNAITLARTLAALAVPLLLIGDDRLAAFAIFALAALTDWADGMLARQLNAQSNFGRMLDPIADKLLLMGCLLALAAVDHWVSVSAWWQMFCPALLIMLREVLVSGLREYVATHNIILDVTWTAKVKTGMQLIAVGVAIAAPLLPESVAVAAAVAAPVLLWVAAILTLISGWDYFRKALRHDIFS